MVLETVVRCELVVVKAVQCAEEMEPFGSHSWFYAAHEIGQRLPAARPDGGMIADIP